MSLFNLSKYFLILCTLCCYHDIPGQKTLYKIPVTQTGIFKIDQNYLNKIGIKSKDITNAQIKIWTGSARMLPQANSKSTPTDLNECATMAIGLEDGKFDKNDLILFYGVGNQSIFYDSLANKLNFETHLYDNHNNYFLEINKGKGVAIETQQEISASTDIIYKNYDDLLFYEVDKRNILGKSGQVWLGDELNTSKKVLNLDFGKAKIIPNSLIKLNISLTGNTVNNTTNFNIKWQGNSIDNFSVESLIDYEYAEKAKWANKTYAFENKGTEAALAIELTNNSRGFADKISIETKRPLIFDNALLHFQVLDAKVKNITGYQIENANNNLMVWDITNTNRPINQKGIFVNGTYTFLQKNDKQLSHFVAFEPKLATEPQPATLVNYSWPSISNETELIIVSPKSYLAAALRLADHRTNIDKIPTQVVDIEQVYLKYSGGKVDVSAIRNLARDQYQISNGTLKYLLLFGDASYDFRNIDNLNQSQDYIPSYQSRESFDPVASYSSDDFFGFLEKTEGEWPESTENNDNHTLDIGIGRIPVRSPAEAEGIVNKLIYYDQLPNTAGAWRQKLSFVSDDGDSNLHQYDTEDLIEITQKIAPNFTNQKIYVDAFERVPGNTFGRLSPGTNQAVKQSFYEGSLMFNYVGHGGPKNLSDEKILTRDELATWQNKDNMPIMITATCEFGRYDNPGELSGAETAILNPNGGAIALLTTTRPVYSITNKKINEAFYNAAFGSYTGKRPRLGDIMRITKNNSFERVFNRNFTLLGDPSMPIAYPQYEVLFTRFENMAGQKVDTLKATESVTISGQIVDPANQTLKSNFSGWLELQIFDKANNLSTMGNNKNIPMAYNEYTDLLVQRKVKVVNGNFTVKVTLPKNINFRIGRAKITAYAYTTNKDMDASGIAQNKWIGGSANKIITDITPPTILLQNNRENQEIFTVKNTDKINLKFFDASGINLNNSAIGHETMIRIDKEPSVLINRQLKYTDDSADTLSFELPVFGLSLGTHSIVVESSDIFNNKARKTFTFQLDGKLSDIQGLKLNPNPIQNQASLSFYHKFGNEAVNVLVKITNMLGQPIHQFNFDTIETNNYISRSLPTETINIMKRHVGTNILTVEVQNTNTKKMNNASIRILVLD